MDGERRKVRSIEIGQPIEVTFLDKSSHDVVFYAEKHALDEIDKVRQSSHAIMGATDSRGSQSVPQTTKTFEETGSGCPVEVVESVEEGDDKRVKRKIHTKRVVSEDPLTNSRITTVTKTETTEVTKVYVLKTDKDVQDAKLELGTSLSEDDLVPGKQLSLKSEWSRPRFIGGSTIVHRRSSPCLLSKCLRKQGGHEQMAGLDYDQRYDNQRSRHSPSLPARVRSDHDGDRHLYYDEHGEPHRSPSYHGQDERLRRDNGRVRRPLSVYERPTHAGQESMRPSRFSNLCRCTRSKCRSSKKQSDSGSKNIDGAPREVSVGKEMKVPSGKSRQSLSDVVHRKSLPKTYQLKYHPLISDGQKQVIRNNNLQLSTYFFDLIDKVERFKDDDEAYRARKIISRSLDLLHYDRCDSWPDYKDQIWAENVEYPDAVNMVGPISNVIEYIFTEYDTESKLRLLMDTIPDDKFVRDVEIAAAATAAVASTRVGRPLTGTTSDEEKMSRGRSQLKTMRKLSTSAEAISPTDREASELREGLTRPKSVKDVVAATGSAIGAPVTYVSSIIKDHRGKRSTLPSDYQKHEKGEDVSPEKYYLEQPQSEHISEIIAEAMERKKKKHLRAPSLEPPSVQLPQIDASSIETSKPHSPWKRFTFGGPGKPTTFDINKPLLGSLCADVGDTRPSTLELSVPTLKQERDSVWLEQEGRIQQQGAPADDYVSIHHSERFNVIPGRTHQTSPLEVKHSTDDGSPKPPSVFFKIRRADDSSTTHKGEEIEDEFEEPTSRHRAHKRSFSLFGRKKERQPEEEKSGLPKPGEPSEAADRSSKAHRQPLFPWFSGSSKAPTKQSTESEDDSEIRDGKQRSRSSSSAKHKHLLGKPKDDADKLSGEKASEEPSFTGLKRILDFHKQALHPRGDLGDFYAHPDASVQEGKSRIHPDSLKGISKMIDAHKPGALGIATGAGLIASIMSEHAEHPPDVDESGKRPARKFLPSESVPRSSDVEPKKVKSDTTKRISPTGDTFGPSDTRERSDSMKPVGYAATPPEQPVEPAYPRDYHGEPLHISIDYTVPEDVGVGYMKFPQSGIATIMADHEMPGVLIGQESRTKKRAAARAHDEGANRCLACFGTKGDEARKAKDEGQIMSAPKHPKRVAEEGGKLYSPPNFNLPDIEGPAVATTATMPIAAGKGKPKKHHDEPEHEHGPTRFSQCCPCGKVRDKRHIEHGVEPEFAEDDQKPKKLSTEKHLDDDHRSKCLTCFTPRSSAQGRDNSPRRVASIIQETSGVEPSTSAPVITEKLKKRKDKDGTTCFPCGGKSREHQALHDDDDDAGRFQKHVDEREPGKRKPCFACGKREKRHDTDFTDEGEPKSHEKSKFGSTRVSRCFKCVRSEPQADIDHADEQVKSTVAETPESLPADDRHKEDKQIKCLTCFGSKSGEHKKERKGRKGSPRTKSPVVQVVSPGDKLINKEGVPSKRHLSGASVSPIKAKDEAKVPSHVITDEVSGTKPVKMRDRHQEKRSSRCFSCNRPSTRTAAPLVLSPECITLLDFLQKQPRTARLEKRLADRFSSVYPDESKSEIGKITRKALERLKNGSVPTLTVLRNQLKNEHPKHRHLVDPIVDVIEHLPNSSPAGTVSIDDRELDLLVMDSRGKYPRLIDGTLRIHLPDVIRSTEKRLIGDVDKSEDKKQKRKIGKIIKEAENILKKQPISDINDLRSQLQDAFPQDCDLVDVVVDDLSRNLSGVIDGFDLRSPVKILINITHGGEPRIDATASTLLSQRADSNLQRNREELKRAIVNVLREHEKHPEVSQSDIEPIIDKAFEYILSAKTFDEVTDKLKQEYPDDSLFPLASSICNLIEQAYFANEFDSPDDKAMNLLRDRLSGKPLVLREISFSLPPDTTVCCGCCCNCTCSSRYGTRVFSQSRAFAEPKEQATLDFTLTTDEETERTYTSSPYVPTSTPRSASVGRGLTWREANERARVLFYRGKQPTVKYNKLIRGFDVRMLLEQNGHIREIPVSQQDVIRLLDSCGLHWDGNQISMLGPEDSDKILKRAEEEAFKILRETGFMRPNDAN
ncbi:hypothetical protein ACOME3_009218 [Neoechinorhynchus agilis]